MLRGHVGCAVQIEEKGGWLPTDADLDEGAVVATLAEQDSGSYSDRVRCPFLEFLFDRRSVNSFCRSLKVSCNVFAV